MSRARRIERFWARYAGSVAFVALIILGLISFARIENARYAGCEQGNLLRKGLRAAEAQNIHTTAQIGRELFPDLPVTILRHLERESVERSVRNITVNYADIDCGTHIQLPLTGASVTLPPGA